MCEANAYMLSKGEEKLIMESVDSVEQKGANVWLLRGLFGDEKTVEAPLKEMKLVDHKIVFES